MTITAAGARWEQVSAPYGIAALRHTHWLDATPRSWEGAPGQWWAEDGRVHGRDLADAGEVTLEPGSDVREGALLLRAFARDGALALRVYDPENPARAQLRGIESYPHADGWVFPGRFTAAPEGELTLVRSIDGYERLLPATGTVALDVHGTPVRLTVSRDGAGLFAVIADAAEGAHPFRFLTMPAPGADGAVTVDFGLAALPPCAFSDQYVCPLPPPQNRLPFAVTAGERRAVHG